MCPAYGKRYNKCNKLNHFAAQCRTPAERMTSTLDKEVKTIEDDMEEVFPIEVVKVGLDDSQLVTVQLKSGCYVRFQVDTGAQCNVLPVVIPESNQRLQPSSNRSGQVEHHSLWRSHPASGGDNSNSSIPWQ